MAELVDALVSGTSGASREGSSPFLGTNRSDSQSAQERQRPLWAPRGTLRPGAGDIRPSSDLANIAFEKVIEERADRGDRTEPRHLVPACGDGGLENVGGKLERGAGDEPPAEAKPCVGLNRVRAGRA